jgi:hypothetical protein
MGRAGQAATAGRLTRGSSLSPGHCFQRHVAGALDGPLVVLLDQDRADEAGDGGLVGEDADGRSGARSSDGRFLGVEKVVDLGRERSHFVGESRSKPSLSPMTWVTTPSTANPGRFSTSACPMQQSLAGWPSHDDHGGLPPDLNWAALADPTTTTAVYMPRCTLPALLETAIAHGLSPDTPALALVNATRSDEYIERGTAASLAEKARRCPVQVPMLILLGRAIA